MQLAFSYSDLAYIALAVFLFAVGLTLAWAFVKLAATFSRLASLIRGVEVEVLPVINKTGGTVDRVNTQLDKVDLMTDSAVDAVDSVDTAIRAVSMAITRPVQKVSGLAAGISYGFADLRTNRDPKGAVRAAKQAAAQREQELAEELRVARGERDGA
jgi:uncharacterized protein YoxC